MKKVVAGMDLHSNNVVIGVMDLDGQRVAHQKVECKLSAVVKFLAPYKTRLEQVAVESTYNWYWLVDGLQARQYPVVLANPAGMAQYSGIKHADDTNDAFFLAELLRLKILPHGGGPARFQQQAERPEQFQMRQQVFGLGVRRGGQLCAALRRAVPPVV
jgi:transposase